MEGVLRQRLSRVQTLIAKLEAAPDLETRAAGLELARTLMAFHYTGLDRMMEIVADASHAGEAIMNGFAQDGVVSNMLLLHDLHPIDVESRIAGALDSVRPYLRSHGGNVELIEVVNGVARIRMEGSCNGCPTSSVTVKTAIEKAIHDAAPDVIAIEAA